MKKKGLQVIVDQGGLAPGGLNFDCKVRRESTDVEDMLIAHVGAMDCFAKALRIVAKIKQDGVMDKLKQVRTLKKYTIVQNDVKKITV